MPQIVRGALDIGSGQHKLLIGLVDTASRRIVQKLRTEQAQVRLGQALLQNSEGALDSAVLARSRSVLTSFREIGEEAGVSEWCGVCTAVFRRANNGDAYLDSANAELDLNLQIIPQQLEGEIGFLSAASGLDDASDTTRLVAWDSGSGSFQLSSKGADGELLVWEGPVGDADVSKLLIRDVQGATFDGSSSGTRPSPNPVSRAHAEQLVRLLDQALPPAPKWLTEMSSSSASARPLDGSGGSGSGDAAAGSTALPILVGIGEKTSPFAVASNLIGSNEFGAEEVWQAVESCLGRSDEELRKSFDGLDEEEDLALPKLLLLHTMLTRRLTPSLGVKRLREQRTMGSCEGVLLCDPLWKR